MKRLLLLGFTLAVSAPSLAPAITCSEACSHHLRRQLSICTSNYAGDSEAIYLCSEEARAEYDSCISNCEE